jgi:hypothetical protein
MIPGNPPHQPRGDDEPVTIDLEANEAARHEAATERRETPPSDATEIPPVSDTAANSEVPHEPVAAAPLEPVPSSAQSSGHGTPALIAAGIVGGLIALICAGAVQYAGLLPVVASSKDNQHISALSEEIDGLKQTVANLNAAPAPDAALQARVAALETAVKNAPQAASAGGSASTAPDPASTQKIADLTAEVDQLKSSMVQTTQTQASTGADINKRLDDAEKKLSEPGKDVAVAQAIAAAGLKAAIDRGGPFHAELDTFAGVSPDDPAVATLRNFADTGVPSRAELIHQVPEVATTIIKASQPPATDEGWSDRLMASAKSLVTVRPVGNIQGDSVEAISARFEDKIRNGDLPGAITEWNALPDAGKSASAAFKQSVEARIKVEDLVGETLSKAIAGAGKQS